MDLGLSGKVAIVGGASGGIGYAISERLAREGCKLVMWARRDPALSDAVARVRAAGDVEIVPVLADVRKAEDHERVVNTALERFGRVDVLVHNDGAPPLGPLMSFDDEAWNKAVNQMLMSIVRLSRLCVPSMRDNGEGRIISIAALAARAPLVNFGLSASTLAALIGYCKTLSRELAADRITVNTICPGRLDTDLTRRALKAQADMQKRPLEDIVAEAQNRIPLKRFGKPEEVAAMVAFLASHHAAFMTGTAIQIDGGTTEALF